MFSDFPVVVLHRGGGRAFDWWATRGWRADGWSVLVAHLRGGKCVTAYEEELWCQFKMNKSAIKTTVSKAPWHLALYSDDPFENTKVINKVQQLYYFIIAHSCWLKLFLFFLHKQKFHYHLMLLIGSRSQYPSALAFQLNCFLLENLA